MNQAACGAIIFGMFVSGCETGALQQSEPGPLLQELGMVGTFNEASNCEGAATLVIDVSGERPTMLTRMSSDEGPPEFRLPGVAVTIVSARKQSPRSVEVGWRVDWQGLDEPEPMRIERTHTGILIRKGTDDPGKTWFRCAGRSTPTAYVVPPS